MSNRIWLARTLFYFLVALRGSAPEGRKRKTTTVHRSEATPIVRLTPLADSK